jgi:hypothetical protein
MSDPQTPAEEPAPDVHPVHGVLDEMETEIHNLIDLPADIYAWLTTKIEMIRELL